MVRGPEELGGLKEHLDDVFVAVVAGGNPRIVGKKEDVHPAVDGGDAAARGIKFSRSE